MIRQIPISEARKRLNELHKEIGPDETVSITSRGKQVFALMSWELYESMTETMAILGDPALMASFEKGLRDMREGRFTDWETLKKEMGVEL